MYGSYNIWQAGCVRQDVLGRMYAFILLKYDKCDILMSNIVRSVSVL